MSSCETKYTTLLDLARQAKVISGETACLDGKVCFGIPFSGYPSGVDTGTTVSLGVISSEIAVFSGDTIATLFDVSNPLSPNYSPVFSAYTATTWTNPNFSANTSGLTLPIAATATTSDSQVIGPIWTLTQTAMTGDYIIGTVYTGYSITYAFFDIDGVSAITGTTTATQENFSAGTLDYKGPLDYVRSKEDGTIDGRLTTNKLTVTDGASLGTIGYVLTQVNAGGDAEWMATSGGTSGSTDNYVSGGTYNTGTTSLDFVGTNLSTTFSVDVTDLLDDTNNYVTNADFNSTTLTLIRNGGLSALTATFTGNTSGDCFTDLWVSKVHSCSPLFINPLDEGNIYFGSTSAVTIDLIGSDEKLKVDGDVLVSGDHILHSDAQIFNDYSGVTSIFKGVVEGFNTEISSGFLTTNNNLSGSTGLFFGNFDNYPTDKREGSVAYYGSGYTRSGVSSIGSDFYREKIVIQGGDDVDGMVIKGQDGNNDSTIWFEGNGDSIAILKSELGAFSNVGHLGLALNPDGTEMPDFNLQIGGSALTGTFKFVDGGQAAGKVLTSDVSGVVSWQPVSGGTGTGSTTTLWSAGTGTLSLTAKDHGGGATGDYTLQWGTGNTTGGDFGSVLGGTNNSISASANNSSVVAGSGNTIFKSHSVILGGKNNTTFGDYSAIVAGSGNTATANYSTVMAGTGNETASWGSVAYGNNCYVDGLYGIIGGDSNDLHGDWGSIIGGTNHIIDYGSQYSTINGGTGNSISGTSSYGGIYGGFDHVLAATTQSVILGGNNNIISGGTPAMGMLSTAFSTINGGSSYGAIIGGFDHLLSAGTKSLILGGDNNIIGGSASLILGGASNRVLGLSGVVVASNGSDVLGGAMLSSIIASNNSSLNNSSTSLIAAAANSTIDSTGLNNSIIGSSASTISGTVSRSVILGGNDITASVSDTVYVPSLNIGSVGAGTSVSTLGVDSSGTVISGITKEFFSNPVGISGAILGSFYTRITDGAIGESVYMNGSIPDDFSEVISIEALVIPSTTSSNTTFLGCQYGAIDTQFSATTNSAAIIPSYVRSDFTSLDVSIVFSGITSGDVFGFEINQSGNQILNVVGLKFKYKAK